MDVVKLQKIVLNIKHKIKDIIPIKGNKIILDTKSTSIDLTTSTSKSNPDNLAASTLEEASNNSTTGTSEETTNNSAASTSKITSFSVPNSKINWVYYLNKDDTFKIYKKKADGSETTKICDDERVVTISVLDNWIYYTFLDGNDGVFKLYKINVGGNLRQEICDLDFLGDPSQGDISSNINGNLIIFKVIPFRQPTTNEDDKKNEDERIKKGTHTYEVAIDGKAFKKIN